MKKISYEKECTCGNGSRNRIYDGDRVYSECICAASGIRKSIRDANRCVGRDGNSCEPLNYKSFYVCDFAVAPFNLLKGVLVSFIVFLIYKKISPIFKMNK